MSELITQEIQESKIFTKERALQLGGYSPLPRIVRQAKGLSLASKTVYALLVDYFWNSGGSPIKKLQEKMCHDLGDIDRSTLRKYLQALRDYGLLSWERKGLPARNVYTLNEYPQLLVEAYISKSLQQQDGGGSPQLDAEQGPATNNKVFKDLNLNNISPDPPRPPQIDQNLNNPNSEEEAEESGGLSPVEAGVVDEEAGPDKKEKEFIATPTKSYLRGDEAVDEFTEYAFVSLIKKFWPHLRQPDYTETTDFCKIFVNWGYVSAEAAPEPEGWRAQYNYCHPYTLAHRLVDEAKGWLRKGVNGLKVTIADYERNGNSFDFKGATNSNNSNSKSVKSDGEQGRSGDVQNQLGPSYNEIVYRRRLEVEHNREVEVLDRGEAKRAAMSGEEWKQFLRQTAENLKGTSLHQEAKQIKNQNLKEKVWLNTVEREALKTLGKEAL